ncbi:MAG: hypothetical protein Q8933_19760 [Bacteroidota bacterium]|nr:hypothetical protein [Bacteroidota bacterium]MDP4197095.1 hypothetical protein [Bacteroidota bacterium]
MNHPDVIFYPWLGKNYNDRGFKGKKILILGESHYGDFSSEESNTTIDTVERYLGRLTTTSDTHNWKSFFTKITKICLDKDEIFKEDKDCFWDSVVYYNYLTESLKKNCRPTTEQWENSGANFYKVINYYKPDIVLVLGDALWKHMPYKNWNLAEPNLGYYILDDGKKIFVSSIYHPSSRYCYGTDKYISKEIFKKLIEYNIC